ncbi:sirohydrochlorin chelatase [Roseiconus nitratireducens]|uniref:Sirohydrochlorin chelatase n=1 Tax=Roseiconus nitratireducens TaxID=2605748 RepID=A0A5M6D481_9BACT|nr:sirohydrochlorin chelatase [Roseiconus nitratireducens]
MLLIGHGTRDETGTEEFLALADVLARRVAPLPVAPALLEFQKPTIREAWDSLVQCGATHIRVAPLLLFAAGHARQDIPAEISACAERTPGVIHSQSEPLSRAPSIVDLLVERITHTASDLSVDRRESVTLVMVGRGSHDPCAGSDMRVLGEVTARRAGFSNHAVAFYAMAEPRLPKVLDQVASDSRTQTVLVQPHLLFHGRLYDAIAGQVREAADRHPDVRFGMGGYLGATEEVAEAVRRRAFSPAMAESS